MTLFQPDAHSRQLPVWTKAPDDETALAREAVQILWGRSCHGSVRVATGGTANSRNYLLAADGHVGQVVLKRLPDGRHYRAALRVADAAAMSFFPLHYRSAGLDGVFVPEYGGFGWALTALASGKTFQGDWFSAVGHVVRLVLEGLAKADGDGLGRREPMTDDEVRLLVAMNDPAIQGHLEEVLSVRGRLRTLPLRPTHIDLHAHNLLVDQRGHVTILDIDSIRLAPVPVALGYAAFKLCRQAHVAKHGRGDPRALAKRFLQRALGAAVEGADDLIWLGAKAELLKRLAYIEAETQKGRNDWILDAARHRVGLEEIDRMRLW